MVEPDHPELLIGRQCNLLLISRSSFYCTPKGETEHARERLALGLRLAGFARDPRRA